MYNTYFEDIIREQKMEQERVDEFFGKCVLGAIPAILVPGIGHIITGIIVLKASDKYTKDSGFDGGLKDLF